jgi:membrane-anchored protein YejM (alkaline phosphatase superfamily)
VFLVICIILIYPLSTVATYSLLVFETIMLVFFGLSWVVKGRKILFSW